MAESSSRKKQRQALLAELAIILVVIVTTYGLMSSRIFRLVEQGTYDYRLIFRPQPRQAREIIYMNIDDASLLKFGRWPWPRSHFASIVHTLKRFGASTVFLDIEFPEESPKILKDTITGKSFLHVLDIFEEGARESISQGRQALEARVDSTMLKQVLGGLTDYFNLGISNLRRDIESSIINPDEVFAEAIRHCGNVYSVFFVQEPFARVLVEKLARLKKIEAFAKDHPDDDFDRLPKDLQSAPDARELFGLVKLRAYLRANIEAPTSLAAKDLKLDPDFVSREIETARHQVLEDAISKEVKDAPRASFEEVSSWVVTKLNITNPGNYVQFMRKFFTKASSQQIVKSRHSIQLMPGAELLHFPSSDDFQPPIPLFAELFKGLGFSNVKPDVDGSIRSVPLFWQIGNRIVKHAAFNVVLDHLGVTDKDIEIVKGPAVLLKTSQGPVRIPVDADGAMMINWAGGFLGSFEHRSLDGVRDYLNLLEDYRFHLKQGDKSSKYGHYAERVERIKSLELQAGELEHRLSQPATSDSTDATSRATWPAALTALRTEIDNAYTEAEKIEEEIFAITEDQLKNISRMIERQKAKPDHDKAKLAKHEAILASSRHEMDEAKRYREALRERSEQLSRIIKDRICMVGSVASGTVDLGVMPYQEVYPKVGVHANVINTVLTQKFLRRIDPLPGFLILIGIALASGLLFPRVSILSGSILLIELMAAYIFIAYIVLRNYGLAIDVAGPVFAIFLNYTCISVYRYMTEQRQRRFVEKVFAHYLSQDVIKQLIEDPEKVKLGGEETPITAFFSDVAGFSTISEKLTPTELVNLLNEYLTDMTNILLAHGGTLDKFEGDAIIAFYGAPLKFEDHAARACLSALEMQERMLELRERWKKEGKPMMKMRIGLNSGLAVVGNMGSQERFNYTMMGDTVNLASRLEGANKPYGTFIMISHFTYQQAQARIEARELDRILVVGKLEPVTVYELLARKGQLEKNKQAIVELYNQGIENYRKRDWMTASEFFMKADQQPGGDPPSREYIRRCQEFAAFPPPDDWDGTYQMKDKGK